MKFRVSCLAAVTCLSLSAPAVVAAPALAAEDADVTLKAIGTYDSGIFDESAAEIVGYHADSQRILTVNANSGQIDIIDINTMAKIGSVSAGEDKEINSVAVRPDGLAVAAVEAPVKTDLGEALFFNAATGEELGRLPVGAQPDNVHITDDGAYALFANEGEPADETVDGAYTVDPEGSVSIIALPEGLEAPAGPVNTADFSNIGELDPAIRIFGPENHHNDPARDLEPEYVATANGKAYVTLQENNAIATIDIASATVEAVRPAYIADHSEIAIDTSNKDGRPERRTLPVKGLSMPDSIAAFTTGGQTYYATANEGDAREWGDFSEEVDLADIEACEGIVDDSMREEEVAGNLQLTSASGWNEEKGCYDELYSFGSRSFSIYNTDGEVVFDSGEDFERITANTPEYNSNNGLEIEFDNRSDNKGPEPEAITIGQVGDRTFAFIGAERSGGIFIYDVTDPTAAKFVSYSNNRFQGDLGPEGFQFVSAQDSPTEKPLLIVGYEVSGTTTVFELEGTEGLGDDNGDANGGSDNGSADNDGSSDGNTDPDDNNGDDNNGGSSDAAGIALGITAALGVLAAVLGAAWPHIAPMLPDEIRRYLPQLP